MNSKHVLDAQKDFLFIWTTGVISVQHLTICHSFLKLLASGWHICSSAQKVFQKNKSGTDRSKESIGVAVGGSVCITVGLGMNLCSVVTSLV